jgi:methionyl aminopeptidase
MIDYKTPEQIEIMKHGGRILSDVLWKVMKAAKPGVSELELDKLAEKLIIEQGGEPGFKKVPGYHHTICASTNDVVVHGIPGSYVLKEGDVVGVDCGVFYKGFHTDMSETIRVSEVKSQKSKVKSPQDDVDKFLANGKRALEAGIKAAKLGNRIGNISKAIQDIVEKKGGYAVVRSLIGHGVGRELHEDPEVPGYLARPIERTPLLKEGMTIAVEVIYNMGGQEVVIDHDGWTIRTEDGNMSGVFERTIAITKQGTVLLTP